MRKLNFLFRTMLLLCALIVGSGSASATTITDYTQIVSGKKYYIGATTGGTDYYLRVDGSSVSSSIAGTAVTSKANATVFTFAGGGTSWTIQFESGNYLSLKTSKDNGKVQVVTSATTFTASNQSSKIRLAINSSFCIQKNNSGTQFGSYGNTQTDLWLEEASSDPSFSVSATSLDFDEVTATGSKEKTFTITPANLTADLSISSNNSKYTVTPTSIAKTATGKQTITVTANPTSVNDNMDGKIIISGDDFADDTEVSLSTTVIRKSVELAFDPTSVTITKGGAFTAPAFAKTDGILVSDITFTSSYNDVATVSNAGVIALGTSTGTAIIKATFAQNDVYEAGEATCKITVNPAGLTPEPSAVGYYVKITDVDDLVDGQYLIVNEVSSIAMSNAIDASNNYIDVTISSNQITQTTTTTGAEFTITKSNSVYYIQGSNGKYMGRTSTGNGLNTSDTSLDNTITFDGGKAIINGEQGGNLQVSGGTRFRYYSSSQSPVYLYKKVAGSSPATIDIYVSEAGYATYTSNFDLDFSTNDNVKAYIAKEVSNEIKMVEVEKVEAGTGVLLHATNGGGQVYSVATTDDTTDDVTGNLLVRGNDEAVAYEATGGKHNYILNVVNNELGFYKANGKTVAKNRAFLQTSTAAARISLNFENETTGIKTFASPVSKGNGVIYNLRGQRVTTPAKGLYVKDGKKVVIK